jgi:hypothetical protein
MQKYLLKFNENGHQSQDEDSEAVSFAEDVEAAHA